MKQDTLFILGTGGHARSIADVAVSLNYKNIIFVDKETSEKNLFNFSIIPELPDPKPNCLAIPALGDNHRRQQQFNQLLSLNWPIATIVAPTVSVGLQTVIGPGSFIAHQAHLGPMVAIGSACIINSGAIVDHESCIAGFSHISINASVAGRCRIGYFNFIGAGATIINNITLADHVIVGAGTVIVKSIDTAGTYVGSSVRKIK